jgi:ABC-type uncharacterized transport system auxiliary subunit
VIRLLLVAGFTLGLSAGCVQLPGADSEAAARYMLLSADNGTVTCKVPEKSLRLSVLKLSAGLDTDRVALRNRDTGEFTYLTGVRWIDSAGSMLEQRLASDLECHGYSVVSSHHRRSDQDSLNCEVRALNLIESDGAGKKAEVGLSCVYLPAQGQPAIAIQSRQTEMVGSWRADEAIRALSAAYARQFNELLDALD